MNRPETVLHKNSYLVFVREVSCDSWIVLVPKLKQRSTKHTKSHETNAPIRALYVLNTPLLIGSRLFVHAARDIEETGEVMTQAADVDGSQPDAWRYVVEVQDAGKPADVTGYR